MKIKLRKLPIEPAFKPGDKVVFLAEFKHQEIPAYYPPAGTVGIIKGSDACARNFIVRWPHNCGVKPTYYWWADKDHIAKIIEQVEE